jgi:hypothetical protein
MPPLSQAEGPEADPLVTGATQLIRKMRGRSQAFLLRTSDGVYVVKFLQNPIHHRLLINELVASFLMRSLGIDTPETALIRVSDEFLVQHPVILTAGSRSWSPAAGLHFGSRYPGEGVAVYDFLPAPLCGAIRNRDHFFGGAVFDSWVANTNHRQAIFVRAADKRFRAEMIGHSGAFGGAHWNFTDIGIPRLSKSYEIYGTVTARSLEPWIHRVSQMPDSVIWNAGLSVPSEWLRDDGDQLYRLLEKLANRQRRIGEIVALSFRKLLWSQKWAS